MRRAHRPGNVSGPPFAAANHIAPTVEEQLARAMRPRPLRRPPRWLRAWIRQRIRAIVAAELPDAITYLLTPEVTRNGQAYRR